MTSKKTNLDQWKSKNDIAWEALFERYPILDTINQQGYFEIEAAKLIKNEKAD